MSLLILTRRKVTVIMKSYLLNLTLFMISLLVGIIILEIGIRVIFPQFTPQGESRYNYDYTNEVVLGDANTAFRHEHPYGDFDVPLEFNYLGLRDNKDLRHSTKEDIFVVGDSFAFGYGVLESERFSDRIQKELGFRVFNLGMPSMDFSHYDRMLDYAIRHDAEIGHLIITVCMDNDLRDYDLDEANYASKQSGQPSGILRMVKGAMASNLAVYHLATYWFHNINFLKRLFKQAGLIDSGTVHLDERVLISSVHKLKKISERFPTVVLLVPQRMLWVNDERRHEAERIHARFITLLRKQGVIFIDPADHFRKLPSPLDLHFPNDGHWNARGHEMASEALIDKWPKEWLIPYRSGSRYALPQADIP